MGKKKGTYTSAEERALLAIPYTKGKGAHTEKIRELATKWGRRFGTVWQKWYVLHSKDISKSRDENRKKDISPMVFEAVEFDAKNLRVDMEEQLSMEKGLEEAIKGPLSTSKRAILFPTRLMNRAKKYLVANHPQNVFSFHVNKSDKKYVLLTKKV